MKPTEDTSDISVKRRSKKRKLNSTSPLESSKEKIDDHHGEGSAIHANTKHEINIESDEETDKVVHKKTKKRKKKKKRRENSDEQKAPGDKSNRQLKKEKHAVREAEVIVTKQLQTAKDAQDYLTQWKNDRSSWKFMKSKQIWLHNHKFDQEKVSDDIWPIFIEYFVSAKGNAKTTLIDDAKKVIANMEQWMEKHGEDGNEQEDDNSEKEVDTDQKEDSKPSELSYERARSIIQNVQE